MHVDIMGVCIKLAEGAYNIVAASSQTEWCNRAHFT